MAYNTTIAGQIQRIQDATVLLRNVITNNWGISNIDTTLLNNIADRYNEIPVISTDVFIPIQIETDGKTTVTASAPLTNGYYKDVSIKPFVKVENVNDIIINVENKAVELTTDSGKIEPTTVRNADGTINLEESYNYLQSVSYTIKHATVPTGVKSLGNGSVNIEIPESGWISANTYTITGKYADVIIDGSTVTSNSSVNLKPTESRTITIKDGIRSSEVSITIPAATSALDGTATKNDIVASKTAWTAAGRITGEVTDLRNTTTAADAVIVDDITGMLIVKPASGCYDEDSRISTSITVGEATYALTGNETVSTFDITPSSDDGITAYLTKVTINNGAIYNALAAI
jgi:hypothetical protein